MTKSRPVSTRKSSRVRVMKGWAFTDTVHAGDGLKCRAFFRHRSHAEQTADRFITECRPKVVRATLTLEPPGKTASK